MKNLPIELICEIQKFTSLETYVITKITSKIFYDSFIKKNKELKITYIVKNFKFFKWYILNNLYYPPPSKFIFSEIPKPNFLVYQLCLGCYENDLITKLSKISTLGDLKILKWHKKNNYNGCFNHVPICGNLKTMKWLKKYKRKISFLTCINAGISGNLKNMKWLKKNYLSCYGDNKEKFFSNINSGIFLKMYMDGPYDGDKCKETQILINLKWLKKNGHRLGRLDILDDLMTSATKFGSFKIMKWLKNNGCKMEYNGYYCNWAYNSENPKNAYFYAIESGNLKYIKWLKKHGYPIIGKYKDAIVHKKILLDCAIKKGNKKIIKWIKKNMPQKK